MAAVCEQGLWYLKNLLSHRRLSTEFSSFLALHIQSICELIVQSLSATRRPPSVEMNCVLAEQACQCLRPLLAIVPTGCLDILIKLNTFQILLGCCCSCSVSDDESDGNDKNEFLLTSVLFLLRQLLAHCSNYSTVEFESLLERLCVIHEVITGVLTSHSASQLVTTHCLRIIRDIYRRNNFTSRADDMVKDWSDTAEGVVCALQLHYTAQEIAILSSELIVLFSESSREYQSVIGATGGGEAFVETIVYYLEETHRSLAIVALCLKGCNSLLRNNAANVVMVGSTLRQLLSHLFPVIVERHCRHTAPSRLRDEDDTLTTEDDGCGSDLMENAFVCLKLLAGSNKQFFLESGVLRLVSELLVWHQEEQEQEEQESLSGGPLPVPSPVSSEGREGTQRPSTSTRVLHKMHTSMSSSLDLFPRSGDPSIPSLIAGCDALLVLLGEDWVDISYLDGVDLPSGLLKKLLILHQDEERSLRSVHRRDQREDLLRKALQLVLTILRLDLRTANPKKRAASRHCPLLPATFQLLLYRPTCVPLVELFLCVVGFEGFQSLIAQDKDLAKLQEILRTILEDLRLQQQQQQAEAEEQPLSPHTRRGDGLEDHSEAIVEQLRLFLQNSFR